MSRSLKTITVIGVVLLLAAVVAAAIFSRIAASDMLFDPFEDRDPITQTPADFGVPFESVKVTTADGINLVGWYVPSQNGAAVILQHGYEENRQDLLHVTKMLHEHGYGVLSATVRGHDLNGEEMITFGCREMEDMETWYQFVTRQEEVDDERIGILGQSMGGSLAIQYAVENQQIKAVVAHSPLTSLEDTIEIGLLAYSPIPDPLVPFMEPLVKFWGEQISGCELEEISAKKWIGQISPRPIYVICGGQDALVIEENCRSLYANASEPSTLWFEDTCAHHDCDTKYPEEFEERIIGFFDQYLSNSNDHAPDANQ
jgi:esterase/lipase